jgi:predicted transcriptional regulator
LEQFNNLDIEYRALVPWCEIYFAHQGTKARFKGLFKIIKTFTTRLP